MFLRLRQDPADLEALGQAIKLHEKLQGERDTIEGMIAPIQEQFAILDKNEVIIPDEVYYLLFRTLFLGGCCMYENESCLHIRVNQKHQLLFMKY